MAIELTGVGTPTLGSNLEGRKVPSYFLTFCERFYYIVLYVHG